MRCSYRPLEKSMQMQCVFNECSLLKNDFLYCPTKHVSHNSFLLVLLSTFYYISCQQHRNLFLSGKNNHIKSWIFYSEGNVSGLSLAQYAIHAVYFNKYYF